MKVRADIVELLRAGCSDREITRRLHVDGKAVAVTRRTLGFPLHTSEVRPAASPQDLFRARTRPVTGGHLEWTGYRTNAGTPFFRWMKQGYTAYRIAFVMAHNRPPVGRVQPGCGHPGCVAPAHVEDQPMRARLKTQMTSIFGGAL